MIQLESGRLGALNAGYLALGTRAIPGTGRLESSSPSYALRAKCVIALKEEVYEVELIQHRCNRRKVPSEFGHSAGSLDVSMDLKALVDMVLHGQYIGRYAESPFLRSLPRPLLTGSQVLLEAL